jgi:hypothetical protein
LARGGFARRQELRKIGIGDAPTLADVNGAKRAGFDPLSNSGLGHFQPVSNFLHRLISVLRHGFLLRDDAEEYSIMIAFD